MYGLVEDISMEGGWVHAPSEPGLGYAIDWDRLRKGHTATLA
jgi:L-alanine-DL-glutamate epimerase-like enolase superfamily enzyme